MTGSHKSDEQYQTGVRLRFLAIVAQPLHQLAGAGVIARREQQVHMVGHQDVGVQRATAVEGALAQHVEVGQVVVPGSEAGSAVIPSLDDMQRYRRQDDAGRTWHESRAMMKTVTI
jgi:hypothetical protein